MPAVTLMSKRKKQLSDFPQTTGWDLDAFVEAIISTLEQIRYQTGQRPATVFDNWLKVVKTTLDLLPQQFKAVLVTGSLAPVSPELIALFQRAEQCEYKMNKENPTQIWPNYATAFYLLLEATAPGLGDNDDFYSSTSGPDILGYIYESWANPSAQWLEQCFTPWDVCELMAWTTIRGKGERQVLDRLVKALQHPDKLPNAAVLLQGLLIPQVDRAAYKHWLVKQLIPAVIAAGQFEPLKIYDPAVGSARSLLALARQFPPWANRLGLVQYFGQDFDLTCTNLAQVSLMIYGLNGYALSLKDAISAGLIARQAPDAPIAVYPAHSKGYRQLVNTYNDPFQAMYKAIEQSMLTPARVGQKFSNLLRPSQK